MNVRSIWDDVLWILGAAVALAAFSYYDWLAGERQMPLRQMLRVAWGWKVSIAGGVLLRGLPSTCGGYAARPDEPLNYFDLEDPLTSWSTSGLWGWA